MKAFWNGFWAGLGMGILGLIGLDGYEDIMEKTHFVIGIFSGICLMILICLSIAIPIALIN